VKLSGDGTVFLVRHGKTSFNKGDDSESRLKGTSYDLPLTDEGHKEAEQAAQHLSQYPIGSIHHSDMLRAAQTATHIEKATGQSSSPDKRLDPWNVGYLAGQTRDDAKRRIEYYINNPHKTVPDGEPYEDFHSKFDDALTGAMKRASNDPDHAHVLVTHSCNAMAAKSIVKGDDPKFYGEQDDAPGHVMRIQKRGGQWRMSKEDIEGNRGHVEGGP
jgi:alpha-ribazole phosphatase